MAVTPFLKDIRGQLPPNSRKQMTTSTGAPSTLVRKTIPARWSFHPLKTSRGQSLRTRHPFPATT